jgi:hypothetical protein
MKERIIKFLNRKSKHTRKWKVFLKKYRQPSWCNYPEAMTGMMGCWSLMFTETKDKRKEKCFTCDLSKFYNENSVEVIWGKIQCMKERKSLKKQKYVI